MASAVGDVLPLQHPATSPLDVVVDARYEGILTHAAWRIGATDGSVRLDYEYAYDGEVDLLGVGFDLPAGGVSSKTWLGRGPYRVYRNRMEGVVFDLHDVAGIHRAFVANALDPHEGLSLAREKRPDLVLLDLDLPGDVAHDGDPAHSFHFTPAK